MFHSCVSEVNLFVLGLSNFCRLAIYRDWWLRDRQILWVFKSRSNKALGVTVDELLHLRVVQGDEPLDLSEGW
jgi:hypothetical protein